jgi:non-ribosomal peptide synthetase component F
MTFNYSTDLFDAETIEHMVQHFQTLLTAISADPHQRLSDLPLLTAEERHQLLVEWNQTALAYPSHLCIHHLFEAQAEHTPDAIALLFQHQQLTYRELNKRANQLAHLLREMGVGPERLVAICLERSPEMIVAVLAVLKAGGAYLPLDVQYPAQRLSFMLEDAEVTLVLTQESLREKLRSLVTKQSLHLLSVDAETSSIAAQPEENPQSTVCSSNLAYLIYTSGSTGQPKAVLAPHRGAINRFAWMWNAFPFAGCPSRHHPA